jgi:DNA-directed RNA polymerase specialized sigma subunit
MSGGDEHLRSFAQTLERAIARYGDLSEEDVTTRQKRQIETLVGLEVDFRKALQSHPAGRKTYDAFAHYICQERRNILAARPFFRERQGVFMDHISGALKAGDGRGLYPFGINYQFVRWVVGSRAWPKGSRILKLARDIDKVRTELVEMNMPLALSRTKIFWGRTRATSSMGGEVLPGGSHIDYMDLVQIAAEGLISGIDKFCLPYSPVFRSVAIGRMVGNFIEQFSETLIHFYPGDKRKIYRARKLIGKLDSFDINQMVDEINKGMDKKYWTNPSEIANLMSASACESADAESHASTEGDEESIRRLDTFCSDPEQQPDRLVETAELRHVISSAVAHLSLFEQKFLRLRGVGL